MLERDIEKAVCDYARRLGCRAYKFTSPTQRAVPDRIFVFPNGYVVFGEFKREGVTPTRAQWHEIGVLRDRGQLVCVIDNIQDGREMVDEIIRRPPLNIIMTLKTQPEKCHEKSGR